MKCWACKRQARGYDHTGNRHGVSDSRHYPIDQVFCSRRCQGALHALYGNWQWAKEGRIDKTEVTMVDPSDVELAAVHRRLKVLGEATDGVGFAKSLGDHSEAEALWVIDVIVTY